MGDKVFCPECPPLPEDVDEREYRIQMCPKHEKSPIGNADLIAIEKVAQIAWHSEYSKSPERPPVEITLDEQRRRSRGTS